MTFRIRKLVRIHRKCRQIKLQGLKLPRHPFAIDLPFPVSLITTKRIYFAARLIHEKIPLGQHWPVQASTRKLGRPGRSDVAQKLRNEIQQWPRFCISLHFSFEQVGSILTVTGQCEYLLLKSLSRSLEIIAGVPGGLTLALLRASLEPLLRQLLQAFMGRPRLTLEMLLLVDLRTRDWHQPIAKTPLQLRELGPGVDRGTREGVSRIRMETG
jgi:hypothetical protein